METAEIYLYVLSGIAVLFGVAVIFLVLKLRSGAKQTAIKTESTLPNLPLSIANKELANAKQRMAQIESEVKLLQKEYLETKESKAFFEQQVMKHGG